MAADEELKKIYNAFSDCWKLYKNFVGIRQEDEARWEVLIDEADAIIERYEKHQFVRDLISAVMGELERESMKRSE